MVLDRLQQAFRYESLGERLARGLQFLAGSDLTALSEGRHAIDGDDVFASVATYDTKPEAEGVWEAHRRHIDIQCLAWGRERLGFAHLSSLACDPYDAEKDVLFASGTGDFALLEPGRFAILFPHDAHMPGIAPDGIPGPVKKVVVKVRLDD